MKRLFGTDGIRGVAGEPPLDPAGVRRFGAALAVALAEGDVVLGRDTRESGEWLRDAVAAGLASCGRRAIDAGVITTPGLAHAVTGGGYAGGVMISASHNPFLDNGLKVFGADGMKLSDRCEAAIERTLLDEREVDDPPADAGSIELDASLAAAYERHLAEVVGERGLEGTSLVLDCANGAAFEIAPRLFRALGAEVHVIGAAPDGRNINLDCGSLHLDALAARVRECGAALGVAFDGDADRVLAVDRHGRPVDGDAILWILGRHLDRHDGLPGRTVVATIMSNLWLEQRLADDGIELVRTGVGDKYVLERMERDGLALGGEQSGHVILRRHATTGDGMLTALVLIRALREAGESLDSLVDRIEPCPQVLLNVPVRDKPTLRDHPRIGPEIERIERTMGQAGRVVLRYSGTEPLARVMVEGRPADAVRQHAARLAQLIEEELGG